LTVLLAEFIARYVESRRPAEPEQVPQQEPVAALGGDKLAAASSPAAKDLLSALEAASQTVEDSNGQDAPQLETTVRIFVASMRWLSDYTGTEALANHESNLIYRLRNSLEAAPGEKALLFRSMLPGANLRPGWYWSAEGDGDYRGMAELLAFAQTDKNVAVRAEALRVLAQGATDPEIRDKIPDNIAVSALEQEAPSIRKAGLKLAAQLGTDPLLEKLASLHGDDSIGRAAIGASVELALRRDPDSALSMLIDNPAVASELSDAVLEIAISFSEEGLALLRGAEASEVKKLSLLLDIARGVLTDDRARALAGDKDIEVALLAIEELQQEGWTFDGELVDGVFKRAPSRYFERACKAMLAFQLSRSAEDDSLKEKANFYLAPGWTAYEALAQKAWDDQQSLVRRDLLDRFETYTAESKAALESKYGERASTLMKADFRDRFILAGLSLLADRGRSDDADVVKSYVDHQNGRVALAALATLARLRTDLAVEAALAYACGSRGQKADRKRAADLALRLAPAKAASVLLESSDGDIVAAAVPHLGGSEVMATDLLRALLLNEAPAVRKAAVEQLADILKPDDQADLLQWYLDQSTYYYNVVAFLDRCLYCPAPFRKAYS
jgi:hypothetical protein